MASAASGGDDLEVYRADAPVEAVPAEPRELPALVDAGAADVGAPANAACAAGWGGKSKHVKAEAKPGFRPISVWYAPIKDWKQTCCMWMRMRTATN
jgi:hypothetical protein